MEPLNEEQVVVVNIENGINLSSGNDGIFLTASLGGNKLESDVVVPSQTTKFDCNLIFQTDRKSVKRMKTENFPIKIECYSVRGSTTDLKSAVKENIGYILVPTRNIPVLPVHKAIQQRPRWYRLIGLSKEWKQHRPEFLLNLLITDKDFLSIDRTQIEPDEDCGDSVTIESNPSKCMLTSQQGIFIRLLEEEGVLQVGNIDTHCDIFLVKILLRNLKNLDTIIPTNESTKEITVNYNLLGNSYICIPKKNFNRIHGIREKIAIHFRSSLITLKDYFEKVFHIPIEIHCNDSLVGRSKIQLENLLKITDLKLFLEKYSGNDSTFEIEGLADVEPTAEESTSQKPLIEYRFSIKYIATKKLHQTELMDSKKRNCGIDIAAGGDRSSELHLQIPTKTDLPNIMEIRSESEISSKIQGIASYVQDLATKSHHEPTTKSQSNLKAVQSAVEPVQSSSSCQTDAETLVNLDAATGDIKQLPRMFSYNLQLKSIQFYKKPETGIWQIGFHHEKADTQKTYLNRDVKGIDNDTIEFADVELRLYFTSSSSEIVDLIKLTDCCTLSIKGPHQTYGKAFLDCNNLIIGIKEKVSGMCLLENPNGEKIGIAHIFVYLSDLGVNFSAQMKTNPAVNETRNVDEATGGGLLDESLAYKMVEELEEWKIKQKELFMNELKQKELSFLEQLKNDFHKKTAIQEEELVQKLEKYSRLVSALEEAHKSLEEKGIEFYLQEQAARKIRHDLEKNFADQLMNYRERVRRLESDFEHEKRLDELKFRELEANKRLLEKEQQNLNETICQLQEEIQELKKNVPREKFDQLAHDLRVLKENFDRSEKSRKFYKEMWAKTTREVHLLQQEKIQQTKEVLCEQRFDRIRHMLQDENSNLQFDKSALDEIKFCIDDH